MEFLRSRAPGDKQTRHAYRRFVSGNGYQSATAFDRHEGRKAMREEAATRLLTDC